VRLWIAFAVAVLFGVALLAQETAKPAAWTPEEALIVRMVMEAQKGASAECDALDSVKRYTALLTEANKLMAAKGKAVDWRTGKPAVPAPAVGDPQP